jgi:Putative regulator of cell autolysis
LLLQPFIENAIWHGLMHKQGEKKLDISFCLQNNHLECTIEDNGIGRERSAEIKRNKLGSQYFESKGTQLSGQRIQLLNETGHTRASIQIDDLKKDNGESEGTRVILKLPLDYET